mmetsp:Transcript_26609/g.36844  ORF Transcript_26609/g.36844 Transcript_26609/m.36844 type:complete len:414 (-) Transcript_26609:149-1390(-)
MLNNLRKNVKKDEAEGKESRLAPQKKAGRRKKGDYNAWISRVYSTQKSKITPEFREMMRQKAKRFTRITKSKRKANKLRLFSAQAQSAWSKGYNEIQVAQEQKDRSRYAASAAKQVAVMSSLQKRVAVEEDDAAMAQYDDIEEQEQNESVKRSEIEAILKQLRNEPSDDEEIKAKFKLYETFLGTVEAIRKETFTFWDETKGDFGGNGRLTIDHALKRIDGHDNMAIDFDSRDWFVHGMTVKAVSNRTKISAVLKNINAKLELMENQNDCPICLDTFAGTPPDLKEILKQARLSDQESKFKEASVDVAALLSAARKDDAKAWDEIAQKTGLKPGHLMRLKRAVDDACDLSEPKATHTLACCHQVCEECWEHFTKGLHGQRPRCPLCRTDDFLTFLAQEAQNLPKQDPAPEPEN